MYSMKKVGSINRTSPTVSPPLSNVVMTGTWFVQAAADKQVKMIMKQQKMEGLKMDQSILLYSI